MNTPKIDFVIPWVDGDDPDWLKEKNKYLQLTDMDGCDASDERFRDWNNLRYWFRSVEKYAPWVNKVYFITWGHIPEWLNVNCNKLEIIHHSDYIPEKYLPVFSSHPIELNLHRIPSLSDQFVYFNDDLFLTAPVEPTDFFRNNLPCDSLVEQPIEFNRRSLYNSIRVNDVIFANQHFNRAESRKRLKKKMYSRNSIHDSVKNLIMGILKNNYFFGFDTHHIAQPYLKKTFYEAWEADYEWLNETCSHRFRNENDISQHSLKFWQLLQGSYVPYDRRRFGKILNAGMQTSEICKIIRNQSMKCICINDSDVENLEETSERINQAFHERLPEKSIFELKHL